MRSRPISVFAQLCNLMPRATLLAIDSKHRPKKANAQKYDAWDHLIALVFCHIARCSSLREVEHLSSLTGASLAHAGGAAHMRRTTLAYANANRDYHVFEEFYYAVLRLFEDKLKLQFQKSIRKPVFSLDSTTITVCVSLFRWARFRCHKGGFKLHTVLSHDLMLPEVVDMTDGKVADVKMAKRVIEELPAESLVIMDRGYNNYALFMWLREQGTHFVTRLKKDVLTTPLRKGLRSEKPDQWGDYEFTFAGYKAKKICGDTKFRCVQWHDVENDRWFDFLTDDFDRPPEAIAELYRSRWGIELFFKKLKQNIYIQGVLGRSENAVMNQVWAALITTLLVELLRRESTYPWRFSHLFSYLNHALLSRADLENLINHPQHPQIDLPSLRKQIPTVQETIPFS